MKSKGRLKFWKLKGPIYIRFAATRIGKNGWIRLSMVTGLNAGYNWQRSGLHREKARLCGTKLNCALKANRCSAAQLTTPDFAAPKSLGIAVWRNSDLEAPKAKQTSMAPRTAKA